MKKFILLSVLTISYPLLSMAQDDDLYFVPSKETKKQEVKTYGMPKDTYYVGSKRSSRDYNRRAWSQVAPIDSAGNDIVNFSAVKGVYPDSAYTEVDDYACTRKMSRFDGYTPSEEFWAGYRAGQSNWGWRYGWYDPWYDPWYTSWYDPWYYGSRWGWYSPYYYSTWYSPWYYGYWDRPYYWGYWTGGGHVYASHAGRPWSRAGVSHHKYANDVAGGTNRGNLGGYRSYGYQNHTRGNSSYGNNTYNSNNNYNNRNNNLGGYRSQSNSNYSNRSNTSYSSGSSSFGGSRSGSYGGGGGRSVGGGHSYGGRR